MIIYCKISKHNCPYDAFYTGSKITKSLNLWEQKAEIHGWLFHLPHSSNPPVMSVWITSAILFTGCQVIEISTLFCHFIFHVPPCMRLTLHHYRGLAESVLYHWGRGGSSYLFQYWVLPDLWLVWKDQHGHCSILEIRHPSPKSSLSLELKQRRGRKRNQCSIQTLAELMLFLYLFQSMFSLMFLTIW